MGTLRSLMFDWTAERINTLKALYADGLSFSQIAETLGCGTRNAAIGKATRLGLTRENHPSSANRPSQPRHRPPANPRPVRHHPVRQAPKIGGRGWNAGVRMVEMAEPMPEVDDDRIPLKQRKTLLELENCHCRWPCGAEPAEFYCGHPSADVRGGRSYCAAHAKRASAGLGRRGRG